MAKTAQTFTPIGQGVEYAIDGNQMTIHVDLDPANGSPSASGKMTLFGNTGGWQNLPGPAGLRANVMVGKRA